MARRGRVTFESRVERAKEKIREKPENALKEIGKLLVKEIKAEAPKGISGRLKKSIGSWYRRQQKDLQIGSKSFYATMVEKGTIKSRAKSFIEATVMKHLAIIQQLIEDALAQLNRED